MSDYNDYNDEKLIGRRDPDLLCSVQKGMVKRALELYDAHIVRMTDVSTAEKAMALVESDIIRAKLGIPSSRAFTSSMRAIKRKNTP